MTNPTMPKLLPDRCGCGGNASTADGEIGYLVICHNPKCAIRTGEFPTQAMARSAWTRAMSRALSASQQAIPREAVGNGFWEFVPFRDGAPSSEPSQPVLGSEGDALEVIKRRIDYRLNEYLCEMKPDHDDSITGFNEAWDIVSDILKAALPSQAPNHE